MVATYAQRTVRFNATLKIFADNLSAKTGARLLKKLAMPVSSDTLLRLLKSGKVEIVQSPRVLGVDDFAFRRGQTYGTLLINLETHRPIDLLPDRRAASLIEWLKAHPGIEIISRDRSTEYTRAINEGAPKATQVADRWHILKNLREVLERLLNRLHSKLVATQKANQTKPNEQTQAPSRFRNRQRTVEAKLSQLKRHHRYQQVIELYQSGSKILHISQELGMSRSTIYNFINAGAFPERASIWQTKKMLEPYEAYLEKHWEEGCHNAKTLWQGIVEEGYKGSYSPVKQWASLRRNEPGRIHSNREKERIEWQQNEITRFETELGEVKVSPQKVVPVEVEMTNPSKQQRETPAKPLQAARQLAWLLIRSIDKLKTDELQVLQFIRQEEEIEKAYELAQKFVIMVKERTGNELEMWLAHCTLSGVVELENFAASLQRELGAIKAGLTLSYSNGPTEGQVNKLKMIKRTLYGRAGFEVLRRRVLLAS